jgi:hypothetical protein
MEPQTPIDPNQNQPVTQTVTQPQVTNEGSVKSIVTINLIIFLIYYLATIFFFKNDRTGSGFLFLGLYLPHAFILMIMSFIQFARKRTRSAAAFAFTAIALGIVGFGACTATLMGNVIHLEL